PPDYTFTTGDAGTHVFSITAKKAGASDFTVSSAGMTAKATVAVIPGGVVSFVVTGLAGSTAQGAPLSFTVSAYDAQGNLATNYLGTVIFTSTDARATLPASYTFTVGDAGAHTFTGLVFDRAGTQPITVTDSSNGANGIAFTKVTNVAPSVAVVGKFIGNIG